MISVVVGLSIYSIQGSGFEQSFRDALFQVVSVITTTGYITADYTAGTPAITIVFFVLMFVGASAGSTAGGVKIVRHLILINYDFVFLFMYSLIQNINQA